MAALDGYITGDSRGQAVVFATPATYLKLLKGLLDDSFTMCADLCGVDYLDFPQRSVPDGVVKERFEVVVNLLSIERAERIRIRCQVPEDNPSVATLFDLWPGTEAMERECYDMFGIRFDGHPDLTRILMPEDWDGHPLRKDYEAARIPVQFKAANS
jgi:NADH-quinone oxidoreductase subunit C